MRLGSGWVLTTVETTTPWVLGPPPRIAKSRSGFWLGEATTVRLEASATHAERTWSKPRP